MPKKKGWDGKVPFTESGSMLGYPHDYKGRTVRYQDNFVFEATLTYEMFDGGVRSARRLWFHDEDNRKYCMFISELKSVLAIADVKGLRFKARWTFRKQGQEYSLYIAPPTRCFKCEEVPEIGAKTDWKVVHKCAQENRRMSYSRWEQLQRKHRSL